MKLKWTKLHLCIDFKKGQFQNFWAGNRAALLTEELFHETDMGNNNKIDLRDQHFCMHKEQELFWSTRFTVGIEGCYFSNTT